MILQKSDSNRKAKVILIVVGKHEIGTKVILQKIDINRKAKVILIVIGKHEIGTKVILQKSDSNRNAYIDILDEDSIKNHNNCDMNKNKKLSISVRL